MDAHDLMNFFAVLAISVGIFNTLSWLVDLGTERRLKILWTMVVITFVLLAAGITHFLR